jgi:hypothetical protein
MYTFIYTHSHIRIAEAWLPTRLWGARRRALFHTYVYMHAYIHTCSTRIHACIYTYMFVNRGIHRCLFRYVHIYTYVHMHGMASINTYEHRYRTGAYHRSTYPIYIYIYMYSLSHSFRIYNHAPSRRCMYTCTYMYVCMYVYVTCMYRSPHTPPPQAVYCTYICMYMRAHTH